MRPTKDTCKKCSSAIQGRNLKCIGPCGQRFHLDCLKFGDAEFEAFTSGGSSVYRCEDCLTAARSTRGDSTPVRGSPLPGSTDQSPVSDQSSNKKTPTKKVLSPERKICLPEISNAESLAVQIETVRLNTQSIVDTLNQVLGYVKSLESDIKDLKIENAQLKNQVSLLVGDRIGKVTEPSRNPSQLQTSYSAVVAKATCSKQTQRSHNITPGTSANTAHSVANDVACNPTTSSKPNQKNEVITVNSNKATSPREPKTFNQSNDETEWVTVGKKRSTNNNKRIVVGNKSITNDIGLKTVPKKGYLFVSRLDPSTTVQSLESFVKESFPEAQCEPLKSKFPNSYASFKITINSDNIARALDTNIWPQGVLVTRFFQRRRPQAQAT